MPNHLTNSASEAFGLASTKAFALMISDSSSRIVNCSVEATSADDRSKLCRARAAFSLASATPATEAPTRPTIAMTRATVTTTHRWPGCELLASSASRGVGPFEPPDIVADPAVSAVAS